MRIPKFFEVFNILICCVYFIVPYCRGERHRFKEYCGYRPIISVNTVQSSKPAFIVTNVTQHVLISNVAKYFIKCSSTRNVEWDYEGHGVPSKVQEFSSVEIHRSDSNRSNTDAAYCMRSELRFYSKQSNLDLTRHTGTYTCREIGNPSNNASIHVFITRKNTPVFLQSQQQLKLDLRKENFTELRSSEKNEKAFYFYMPCAVSNPTVNVTLHKRQPEGTDFKDLVSTDAIKYSFDPKSGFRIELMKKYQVEEKDLEQLYGEYKCIAPYVSNQGVLKDFVFIELKKSKQFKVEPAEEEIYTWNLLNLTCIANEPVLLKEVMPYKSPFSYFYDDPFYDHDYYYDPHLKDDESGMLVKAEEITHLNQYVANFLEHDLYLGSYGEIQCLTEKGRKVLHTWKYHIVDKRQYRFAGALYNPLEKAFTCRSRSGEPGELSVVSCKTPSECRINRVCLSRSTNCRGYSSRKSIRVLCDRHTKFCGKVLINGGSGLVRCIGDGIDEVRPFTDEGSWIKTFESSSSKQSIRNQLKMGFDKLKASETIKIRLKEDNDGGVNEGDDVVVKLDWSYYFFVQPLQWAIGFENRSWVHTVPLEEDTIEIGEFHRSTAARIHLPKTSDQNDGEISPITTINALIPLRSSNEPSWKTIVLPIKVNKLKNTALAGKTVSVEGTKKKVRRKNKLPVKNSLTKNRSIELEAEEIGGPDQVGDSQPQEVIRSNEDSMTTGSLQSSAAGSERENEAVKIDYPISSEGRTEQTNDASFPEHGDQTKSKSDQELENGDEVGTTPSPISS